MKLTRRIAKMPEDIYREIKFGIQRAKKGYSSRDVWSFDEWFLRVVPKMLRDLEKMEHGYPLTIQKKYYLEHLSDYPVSLTALTEDYDENDKKSVELKRKFSNGCSEYWKATLIRMAGLLEESRGVREKYADYRERDAVRSLCIEEFCGLLSEYFDDLWA